jgi:YafQ family addiction module toxin component
LTYVIEISPTFQTQLNKIMKKDKVLFERIFKKINDIELNPEHYKPLKNILKGFRRAHIDPFVLIFEINNNKIIFLYIKHHDEAYF